MEESVNFTQVQVRKHYEQVKSTCKNQYHNKVENIANVNHKIGIYQKQ